MESVELLELMEVGDDIALLLTQAQCSNLGVSLGDALHVTPRLAVFHCTLIGLIPDFFLKKRQTVRTH